MLGIPYSDNMTKRALEDAEEVEMAKRARTKAMELVLQTRMHGRGPVVTVDTPLEVWDLLENARTNLEDMLDLAGEQFLWLRSHNFRLEPITETLDHLVLCMRLLAEDLEEWHEQDRMAALNATLWRHWRDVPTHLLKERGKELYETLEIMRIPAGGW